MPAADPIPLCRGPEFYSGLFGVHYNNFVRSGLLPDPTTLYGLCAPFLRAAAPPARLLDVGIGSGLSARPFKEHWPAIDIHGVDGSALMLETCRAALPGSHLRVLDLEEQPLPYSEHTFPLTISQGSLYMLANALTVIADMLRVTARGGLVAFNYEASPDSTVQKRVNDATTDPADQKRIITYAHPHADIRAAIDRGGATFMTSQTYVAMKKLDGTQVCFTNVLACKR